MLQSIGVGLSSWRAPGAAIQLTVESQAWIAHYKDRSPSHRQMNSQTMRLTGVVFASPPVPLATCARTQVQELSHRIVLSLGFMLLLLKRRLEKIDTAHNQQLCGANDFLMCQFKIVGAIIGRHNTHNTNDREGVADAGENVLEGASYHHLERDCDREAGRIF
jgi:hypothetical protein